MTKFETINWKEFKICDLFEVNKSVNIVSDDLSEGNIPYVTRTSLNNGIARFVDSESYKLNEKNSIVIGRESGIAFYEDKNYLTGNNITILKSPYLNKNIGLFIVTILNLETPKYCYGRAWNSTKIKNSIIKLPVDQDGKPDWKYMDDYIKGLWGREIDISKLAQSLKQSNIKLEIVNWKEFRIGDLFEVKGSKTTSKEEINEEKEQKYNYVTTQNNNNGVESKSDFFTELGNCITIDSATIGAVFYQEKNFIASDHVEIIKNDKLNKFNSFFIISILKKEQFRYGYGRKWNQQNISNTIIKLPVDQNGNPDWQYI